MSTRPIKHSECFCVRIERKTKRRSVCLWFHTTETEHSRHKRTQCCFDNALHLLRLSSLSLLMSCYCFR